MPEILFYHLQDMTLEAVLPPLLEKSLQRGWRALIHAGSEARAEAIDAHLWTYRDDSFLPHGTWQHRDADQQPVIISLSEENVNGAQVLFLLDGATMPPGELPYERVVVIFDGNDDGALAGARSAWADCRGRGFDVTYWQADEQGRWQRRN